MSKFKPGVRIVVIDEDHELRKGVIKEVYPGINTAIVNFDDGNVEKVGFRYLGIESDTKAQEKLTEPVEKSEITITPDEFRNIAVDVITKESKTGGPLLNIVGTILVSKLHIALFVDEGEND